MSNTNPDKINGETTAIPASELDDRGADGRFVKGNPHAWKKGQSGNAGGRPKGQSITARLRALLEANEGEAAQMIAETLIETAMQGDRRAIEAVRVLLDRTEGPVSQRIALDHGVVHKTVVIGEPAGTRAQLSSAPDQLGFMAPDDTVRGGDDTVLPSSSAQLDGAEGAKKGEKGVEKGQKDDENEGNEGEQDEEEERTAPGKARHSRGPAQTRNVQTKEVANRDNGGECGPDLNHPSHPSFDPDLVDNLEAKLAMSEEAEAELRAALLDEELRKELLERGE